MGSLEKIDDNNFVIKIKTADISNKNFCHGDYAWLLYSFPHKSKERVFLLRCMGPNDDLWNIDANVTWDTFNNDGIKEYSNSVKASFNRSNPEYKYVYPFDMNITDFKEFFPNMKIRVKINSITGVEQILSNCNFAKADNQLSDVALIVEGKKLYVNKAVLATFSPVFRAMFFSGFKESTEKEVVISDVKYGTFKLFLTVIYDPYRYFHDNALESLLVLADRFDVQVVKEKCEKHLNSGESEFTIAKKLILAETYTLPSLHKKCMDLIDTKEKLTEVCENTSQFGPMTFQAIIKKTKDLLKQ